MTAGDKFSSGIKLLPPSPACRFFSSGWMSERTDRNRQSTVLTPDLIIVTIGRKSLTGKTVSPRKVKTRPKVLPESRNVRTTEELLARELYTK